MAHPSYNERRMGRVRNENRFLRLELRKIVHELHIARTVAIALEAELKKHDPPAKVVATSKGVNSVADQLSEAPTGE